MARGVTTEWEDQMVKRGIWQPKDHIEPSNDQLAEAQIDQVEEYNVW